LAHLSGRKGSLLANKTGSVICGGLHSPLIFATMKG